MSKLWHARFLGFSSTSANKTQCKLHWDTIHKNGILNCIFISHRKKQEAEWDVALSL